MRRLFLFLAIAFPGHGVWAQQRTQERHEQAEWMWCDDEVQPGVTAYFRRDFEVPAGVISATIRAAGESASLKLFVDGEVVAELEAYDPMLKLDVTERIGAGRHVLAIESSSGQGPAAVFAQLDLSVADKSRSSFMTNNNWVASKQPADGWSRPTFTPRDWPAATSKGAVSFKLLPPLERQVEIKPVDNYEQWRQALGAEKGTDPATFLVAPGFEIDLVRSAKADEDSWVSMAFDSKGRVVIAKEKQGLLRMTLSPDGARVQGVEELGDQLKECRGLLFAFGDLFVNANNSKGLYRLRGSENDRFGKPQLLYASSGGVGHGRNDLALGPDGKIYTIHGDSVQLPSDLIDFTSPLRRFTRQAGEGHLLRIDPAGGEVELLAAGLRNPFGIDFNADGEIFTYDADAEFDMGSPWYRPTRVSHLVTGGDYGWRAVTKSWPPYYPDHPDNALPNLDIGKGSPTAIKFGLRSNFTETYRNALFILDWAYGRVLAVHMVPRGSSYVMAAETFLQGRPLNVTDLDFGMDGSMYLVTGGRGTQSALYRVRYVGPRTSTRRPKTSQQRSRKTFAEAARGRRRRLESDLLEQHLTDERLDEIWADLADADPWIRHAARNVVERVTPSRWRSRAFGEANPTAAANGLLAVARSHDKTVQPRVVGRLNDFNWTLSARSTRRTALYAYLLSLTDTTTPAVREVTAQRLTELYPDRSFVLNRLLSELLARLEHESFVAKTLELLQSSHRQAEQLHYLHVLRTVKQGWTTDRRKAYFASFARTNQFLGGAGMDGFVERIRKEAMASLTDQQRGRLGALLVDVSPDDVAPTPPRPFVQKWTVATLRDSLSKVDGKRDLRRGERMFSASSCIKCHRFAGKGTLVGPDLTSVSRRFSRRDVLESIITPSKVVAEKYRSLQIVTKQGKSLVGQPALGGDYRSPVLRLAVDPRQPFKITTIPKADISHQQQSPISWMPEGLLDTLTRDEILDLLAYLESTGR